MINISGVFSKLGLFFNLPREKTHNPLLGFTIGFSGLSRVDNIHISSGSYSVKIHRSGQCEISGVRIGHNDKRNPQIKKLTHDLLQFKNIEIPEGFKFLDKYLDKEQFSFTKENFEIKPMI